LRADGTGYGCHNREQYQQMRTKPVAQVAHHKREWAVCVSRKAVHLQNLLEFNENRQRIANRHLHWMGHLRRHGSASTAQQFRSKGRSMSLITRDGIRKATV
jgi:hypothetical protein